MKNNHFYTIINNAENTDKWSQVYLLSAQPSVDFSKYLVYFLNLVNKENQLLYNEFFKCDGYYLTSGRNKNILKSDIINVINKITESNLNVHKKKIWVIENIENGNSHTLNALLKFLENPPRNLIVLMTTNNSNNVLKTIKSRAFEIIIHKEIPDDLFIEEYSNFFNLFLQTKEEYSKIKALLSLETLNELYLKLKLAPKNPFDLLSFLKTNLNSSNMNYWLIFIQNFFLDILKTKKRISNPIILKSKKDIAQYLEINYLNEFILLCEETKRMINNNANFIVQIASFIVKLGELYGI
ncbi:hypothetical protein [[Mycoplasma] anseris]|uniref:DNA polymerase III subunit delta n=1 Tax=[Mycoplasma] anseris TaxID=92400 RepID=A0A2Z4NCM8_9BACT|nr:hypothetical protein [[Mycoplasma] anseris]AWX69309.1 hypothetical protein DP065_00875 [[Mycoplasma] anseris]